MAIEGLGWTFDVVAKEYDKYRPTYIPELYEDIFEYVKLLPESKILEIGVGTGQATLPFLKTGCSLLAIEPGENLAKITFDKFKNYSNFSIKKCIFEEFVCERQHFDFIYSASAFHWINESEGYTKVYDLLKKGGVFARFASHPYYNIEGQEVLFEDIQKAYSKHTNMGKLIFDSRPYDETDAKARSSIASKYGFADIKTICYYRDLIYNSDEYINRLAIESDKIVLENRDRENLFKDIKQVVEKNNNQIIVRDMIDLNLARKI